MKIVVQRDPLSPNIIFNTVLKWWESEVKIKGAKLNHVHIADDIVSIRQSLIRGADSRKVWEKFFKNQNIFIISVSSTNARKIFSVK